MQNLHIGMHSFVIIRLFILISIPSFKYSSDYIITLIFCMVLQLEGYCALLDISSSTPLGKITLSSRCSFNIFLYCLDQDYHFRLPLNSHNVFNYSLLNSWSNICFFLSKYQFSQLL